MQFISNGKNPVQDCYQESGLISSFRFGDTGLQTSHAQKCDVTFVHGQINMFPPLLSDEALITQTYPCTIVTSVLCMVMKARILRTEGLCSLIFGETASYAEFLPGMRKSFRTLTRPHNDYLWQY